MEDTRFEQAEEQLADAMTDKVAYLSPSHQRNLIGTEFLLGAAATLGTLFLQSFLEEAHKQAKRLGKLGAKKIGDLIAEQLKLSNSASERKAIQKKSLETAVQLSSDELSEKLMAAQQDIQQLLTHSGIPEQVAQHMAHTVSKTYSSVLQH